MPRGTWTWIAGVVLVLAVVACGPETQLKTSTSTTTPTVTTVPPMLTSVPSASADLTECVPGNPKPGIDLRYEEIIRAYNSQSLESLTELIGDGPVWDPSLQPNGEDLYPSIGVWLEAAERIEDRWGDHGYGFSEPFELYVDRRNQTLSETGIEGLTLTVQFWLTQDCQFRVETTGIISHPDPCRYFDLYDTERPPAGCIGPFEPRASHAAAWTGSELLIYGGSNGADVVDPLRTGLAYNPEIDTWREISPSPLALSWWPNLNAIWTGDQLILVGWARDGEHYRTQILTYRPEADTWETATVPEEREHVGAVVWTGREILLVGGDLNAPDNTAWAYHLETGQWRRLPDPEINPVEGMEGVWTGTEAIFAGGYTGPEPFPAVAYNPSTDTWRALPPPLGRQLEQHQMVWTGRQVILYSGHGPPHSESLLIYDPGTDSWSESSPMPMLPAERLAGAWTGDHLIIWGGYATYGEHDEDGDAVFGHGAMYDPATDTWDLLPEAPISDRCDHSGTWTGTEFIVFGGSPLCGTPGIVPLGDTAGYDPQANTWRLIGE